jgi:chaperonin GroES
MFTQPFLYYKQRIITLPWRVLKFPARPLESGFAIDQIFFRAAAFGPRSASARRAGRGGGDINELVLSKEENMTFRPLHDRILVRRIEAEEKSAGGIIIPDTAKEKPMEGEVLAVGSGARDERGQLQPLDVKVGDRILFGKWSGTEIRLNGEDLLIIKEADVLGIIELEATQKKAA